ncbi:MAG TPA: tRNA glutamyl-Q(34) synthetase GluQRS [Pseudomonadales bacterium]
MTSAAGRFAPSPTGPLHHGSLLAAAASYLDARSRGLQWWLRIDDLDTPRVAEGAESAILSSLAAHGLHWDGPVRRQSEQVDRYLAALNELSVQQLLFYCTCSRQQLADSAVYPGTCRRQRTPVPDAAVRVRVGDDPIRFTDLIHGEQTEILAQSCGDFVVRRRDGLVAYQLATAVDDGSDEVVRVVRGGDLLDNTARQIFLMRRLGLAEPAYAHLPVLVDDRGQKLSKQTNAAALDNTRPAANLLAVFDPLGLNPPPQAERWTPAELLAWGTREFALERIRPGSVTFRL